MALIRTCIGALAIALVGGTACSPAAGNCEEVGGLRVGGVCQCPEGKQPVGGSCVASAAPTDAAVITTDHHDPADARASVVEPVSDAAISEGTREHDADSAPVPDAGDAQPLDASPTPRPDAGPTSGADAGPVVLCKPTGLWTSQRIEHAGGTCGSNVGPFQVTLHGTMVDAMAAETDCELMYLLSADGCTLTYTMRCPVDGTTPLQTEVETATVTMSPSDPTHSSGTGKVTVEASDTPPNKQCHSDVDIISYQS